MPAHLKINEIVFGVTTSGQKNVVESYQVLVGEGIMGVVWTRGFGQSSPSLTGPVLNLRLTGLTWLLAVQTTLPEID